MDDVSGDLPLDQRVEPGQPAEESAPLDEAAGFRVGSGPQPFESPEEPETQAEPVGNSGGSHGTGRVERGLANYAFVREERDREVRLLFRDVPADDLAAVFRAAGASLITLSGARAALPHDVPAPEVDGITGEDAPDLQPRRKRHRRNSRPVLGALSLRYFYALGETVYTVSITAPSDVAHSVAGIFPVAAFSERELQDRLSVVFTRGGATE